MYLHVFIPVARHELLVRDQLGKALRHRLGVARGQVVQVLKLERLLLAVHRHLERHAQPQVRILFALLVLQDASGGLSARNECKVH